MAEGKQQQASSEHATIEAVRNAIHAWTSTLRLDKPRRNPAELESDMIKLAQGKEKIVYDYIEAVTTEQQVIAKYIPGYKPELVPFLGNGERKQLAAALPTLPAHQRKEIEDAGKTAKGRMRNAEEQLQGENAREKAFGQSYASELSTHITFSAIMQGKRNFFKRWPAPGNDKTIDSGLLPSPQTPKARPPSDSGRGRP